MEKDIEYIEQLLFQDSSNIDELRAYATEHNVPIMDKISTEFVKQMIRIKDVRNILEIGTAIGYSAMHFASCHPNIKVWTIERSEEMYEQALTNIKQYDFEEQVQVVFADASVGYELLPNNQKFDLIFIDAAKAQSKKFFEIYEPFLNDDGIIITDNILYHGFVSDIDIVRNRNVKQMVKKVQQYNQWLMNRSDFNTTLINIGDGMAISKKENTK
ncbi:MULTISPECIES: O-methyltransferase [Mammaliicoccus]|uniref:tRNA 5-hydroxyuridine methyltransferase n=1 Tax=Mammaliicoccus fleurettii TaxID=150056 RepID=A0ABS5MQL7_9STAP|nr:MULTISPECIES: O-methyltransferase [Mammaliicoccus]HCN61435.1 O-methyltransferase [Staphylococcus sp.]MBL0847621.1 O-methyltransferase [Mammaliicoccus fleurettii]MBO3062358.1 O-methyltransferase [Mammaliicoccus fleurettii]MBS3672890.1 O-methyltransferase [Mammaliicoccus fleurettii]MBS3697931.1 O-methyltransferase [Mammaliicoccus fleurettii]